jgi:uncharacterized membrane protein YhaH (DUF805 family)
MRWYLLGFKNFPDIKGRAVRKEFWMFMLFNLLFLGVAMIIDFVFGLTLGKLPFGYVFLVYAGIILVPSLTVTLRRLHDVGSRGWMLFIILVPIIGIIWLITLLVTDSQEEENIFGASPKSEKGRRLVREFSGDAVIIIVVGWMILGRTFYAIALKYIPNFLTTTTFAVSHRLVALIWAFIPITLAFAVRDRAKQMVLFIVGGIYLIYGVYSLTMQLIH